MIMSEGGGNSRTSRVVSVLRRVSRYVAPVLIFVPVFSVLSLGLAVGWESGPEPLLPATQLTATSTPVAYTTPLGAPTAGAIPVQFLRAAPAIRADTPAPHGPRGTCAGCHEILPASISQAQPPAVQAAGSVGGTARQSPAPTLTMLPFQEAHWQGLEMIAFTPGMARILKIPRHARGVIVDEATMPADVQGFVAGDLITAVGDTHTPDLERFVEAANKVREQQQITVKLLRKGKQMNLKLAALQGRLGNANGETAPMIRSGSRPPHGYLGPCTQCHHIGTGMNLAVDLGDPLAKTAPAIRPGQTRPHRDRGKCIACHMIR